MAEDERSSDVEKLIKDLERLLPRAGEDDQGIAIDIDHAIDEVAPLFVESGGRASRVDGVLVWQLDWSGEGHSASSIDRDFYRLLGECAEETLFISRFVEESSMRYEVVLASLRGYRHIHHVRFVVKGPTLASICTEYREIARSVSR